MPPSFLPSGITLKIETYLHNILSSKTRQNQSPTQLLYQKTPSYSRLRLFGCLCYPLFSSTTINKL